MAKGKGKAKEKQATDAELFVVDDAGDDHLRRQLQSSTWDTPAAAHPRRGSGKPLKSSEILAQRSRTPARMSKAQAGVMVQQKAEREKRMKITPDLKKRLRGMVKHANSNGQDRGLWEVSSQQLNGKDGVAAMHQQTGKVVKGDYDMWASTSQAALTVPEDIRDLVQVAKAKVRGSWKFWQFRVCAMYS